MTDDRPNATRADWKLDPLPEEYETVPLVRLYTEAQMEHIRRGFTPQRMEDKWFIFYEAGTLYLHRSWTGYCIYEADLIYEPVDGWVLSGVRVNRDERQYRGVHDEAGVFERLIATFLRVR